jgi:hypothetical protein
MLAVTAWPTVPGLPAAAQPPLQRWLPDIEAATERALACSGDGRIALDGTGRNRYGCRPRPDPALTDFGSSTASVISGPGFQAAVALRARLHRQPDRHGAEIERQRHELAGLSGAAAVAGTELVFAASGTDLHLYATLIAARGDRPLQALMAAAEETGRGVPSALAGAHFGAATCRGSTVSPGTPLAGTAVRSPIAVPLRLADGTPRTADAVDGDFARHAEGIVHRGGQALLVVTDLSKTGMLAPSAACVAALRRQLGERLTVLVDAAQFRLAPRTLQAYLEQGCMVGITGSKFLTGPAFCGALLLPPGLAAQARARPLHALRAYSCRAEWPPGWPAARALAAAPDTGLMLRWEAALMELRRFRAVPAPIADRFFTDWGAAVAARIASDPGLAALPVAPLARDIAGWDGRQTIFPFLLQCPGAGGRPRPLGREETALVHRLMQQGDDDAETPARGIGERRFHLGQPVPCGDREGVAVSALRLCASARWAVAAARSAAGAQPAIDAALLAFDKLAWLVRQLDAGTLRPRAAADR